MLSNLSFYTTPKSLEFAPATPAPASRAVTLAGDFNNLTGSRLRCATKGFNGTIVPRGSKLAAQAG